MNEEVDQYEEKYMPLWSEHRIPLTTIFDALQKQHKNVTSYIKKIFKNWERSNRLSGQQIW